ncbi:MAG: secondary thiamine-phosphate synthase enzyme YjbQ [Acidimicrobiia bacterium]
MDEHLSVSRSTRTPRGEIVVLAATEAPPVRTEVLHFQTEGSNDVVDVTDLAREVLKRSGVKHGQLTLHTPHTTTSLVINEAEAGFLNDYRRRLEALVPSDLYYEHDDWEIRTENLQEDELLNGPAHVRQVLVGGASATVPVVDGQLLLGQWQRFLFIELDQARERRVIVHAQGV